MFTDHRGGGVSSLVKTLNSSQHAHPASADSYYLYYGYSNLSCKYST